MKRPGAHIYVDLETTGLNPNQDRVCQVGIILPNGKEIDVLVNPEIPISPSSTALHGITNETVKNAPKFIDIANELITGLEEAEIFVAYNFTFDFQFLQNELFRTVHYELLESDFNFLDPYKIFRKMFPHNLANAYYFYTGKKIEGAHGAINDIRCTKEVLDKQKEIYSELFTQPIKEIEKITIGDTSIIGKWFNCEDGIVCFKQGKYRGEVVTINHVDYLRWIYSLEDVTMSERRFISSYSNK